MNLGSIASARRRQRGMVMFMALILLLILTMLGVGLARTQTVEERLAQNYTNHQLALQTAEAMLQAAFDVDKLGVYAASAFSGGTPGLSALSLELQVPAGTTLGYNSTWTAPGVTSIAYDPATNSAALNAAPPAAKPQFVIENMPPTLIKSCNGSNVTSYATSSFYIHRITAHANGGDGSASATVQTIRIGGC